MGQNWEFLLWLPIPQHPSLYCTLCFGCPVNDRNSLTMVLPTCAYTAASAVPYKIYVKPNRVTLELKLIFLPQHHHQQLPSPFVPTTDWDSLSQGTIPLWTGAHSFSPLCLLHPCITLFIWTLARSQSPRVYRSSCFAASKSKMIESRLKLDCEYGPLNHEQRGWRVCEGILNMVWQRIRTLSSPCSLEYTDVGKLSSSCGVATDVSYMSVNRCWLAGLAWYLTGQIIKLCFERKRRRQARNEVVAQKEHCRQELGGVALVVVASNIELTWTPLPPSSLCIPVKLLLGIQDESRNDGEEDCMWVSPTETMWYSFCCWRRLRANESD